MACLAGPISLAGGRSCGHGSKCPQFTKGEDASLTQQGVCASMLPSHIKVFMLQEWADYLFPGSTSQPEVTQAVNAPLTSIAGQIDPLIPVI